MMRKKFGLKALAVACSVWVCMGGMALASTDAACLHSNMQRKGQVVGNWTYTHTVTLSASQGAQTCTAHCSVEEVYDYCPDCGHSVLIDTYNHERHTICGVNY